MAHIKVTDKDIRILRVKTDLAHNTLKQAVETQDPIQQSALVSSAKALYEHDIGNCLLNITRSATHSLRRLNKGGKRARKIETFILQYVLMHGEPRRESADYHMEIAENPDDSMGGLKAFLDAEDNRSSKKAKAEEGVVFRLIRDKAAQLRADERYDLILNALNYVRGNY